MVMWGTEEFIKKFAEQVNGSEAYAHAAKDWEGDFLFVTKPEGPLKSEVVYYVDLYHGKCREAILLPPNAERKTAFVYEGPLSSWAKLLAKQLDPIGSLMLGKFKLKGNLGKVLRHMSAAKELVNCVASVPTEFPQDLAPFVEQVRAKG